MTTMTKSPQCTSNKSRSWSTWLVRNGALLLVGFLLFSKIPQANPAYMWLKESYLKNNAAIVKQYPDATLDQRMAIKLGADYNYIVFLRDNTPQDAIIYYPTGGDFRASHPAVEQNPFNGILIDKLTAVRVLYPRKVVVEREYGKTSWSKKITHVAIVNGRNLDKVPYPVPENYVNGILPMKQPTNTPQQ